MKKNPQNLRPQKFRPPPPLLKQPFLDTCDLLRIATDEHIPGILQGSSFNNPKKNVGVNQQPGHHLDHIYIYIHRIPLLNHHQFGATNWRFGCYKLPPAPWHDGKSLEIFRNRLTWQHGAQFGVRDQFSWHILGGVHAEIHLATRQRLGKK